MNKTKLLTYLLASLPTYLSIFAEPIYATAIMFIATLIGVVLTGNLADDDHEFREKLRDSWIIHIVGIFITVLIKNL